MAVAYFEAARAATEVACACSPCDPDRTEETLQGLLCTGRIVEGSGDEVAIAFLMCLTDVLRELAECANDVECASEAFLACNDEFSSGVTACDRPDSVLDAETECRRRLE